MFDLYPVIPLALLLLVVALTLVVVHQQGLLEQADEDCTYAWQREQAALELLDRARMDARLLAQQYELLARAERRNANS